MQRSRDLSRQELEHIVAQLQQALYLRYDETHDAFLWDPSKEWKASDVCDAMAGVLAELRMVPEEVKPYQ